MHILKICVVVTAIAASAMPAIAQRAPFSSNSTAASGWTDSLHAADQDLRAGKWQDALGISRRVEQDIENRVWDRTAFLPLLGMAILEQAVAEEGLGLTDDALWHLRAAESIDLQVAKVDLSVYGDPGQQLRHGDVHKPWPSAAFAEAQAKSAASVYQLSQVTRPRKLTAPPPVYPQGLRQACIPGIVVLDSVIDAKGHVTDVELVKSSNPLMTLAVFDAVRAWTFEPAQLDGHPVKVFYSLTLNFVAPCRPH